MSVQNARPTFGGRLKTPQYYSEINGVLRVLRPYSTLAVMAQHLNSQGWKTPTDKPWTRSLVSQYLKNNDINSN